MANAVPPLSFDAFASFTQGADDPTLHTVPTRFPYYGLASNLTANVLGESQKHLEQTYYPLEDELANNLTYNNPALLPDAIVKGTDTVNAAYDTTRSGVLGQFRQYGIDPTERQMAALNRADNLGRTASIVDAANKIRIKMADRDRAIAAGGIGTQASSLKTTGG